MTHALIVEDDADSAETMAALISAQGFTVAIARTMREHWAAGHAAVSETMANARLVAENIIDGKTAAFDLTQR